MNDFYELDSDFNVEELRQLAKEIKKKTGKRKYNKSKSLEFFKDCLVIKIGTREKRKNVYE